MTFLEWADKHWFITGLGVYLLGIACITWAAKGCVAWAARASKHESKS